MASLQLRLYDRGKSPYIRLPRCCDAEPARTSGKSRNRTSWCCGHDIQRAIRQWRNGALDEIQKERNHKKLRRLYREERFRSAMRSNQTMLLWDWSQRFMWAS